MREYQDGDKLAENEYLLKIRMNQDDLTGFLTKFNQNGTIPKAFLEWDVYSYRNRPQEPLKTYIFEETFRPGWRLNSYRFGKSQNWAEMKHPEGFTVEIYLTNLLDLIHLNTFKNGELIGNFKWEANKLIKEQK